VPASFQPELIGGEEDGYFVAVELGNAERVFAILAWRVAAKPSSH
jgi:hypothetical protein